MNKENFMKMCEVILDGQLESEVYNFSAFHDIPEAGTWFKEFCAGTSKYNDIAQYITRKVTISEHGSYWFEVDVYPHNVILVPLGEDYLDTKRKWGTLEYLGNKKYRAKCGCGIGMDISADSHTAAEEKSRDLGWAVRESDKPHMPDALCQICRCAK